MTTPQGSVVDADVEELSAPGVLGELGILPGHVAFMTALKPGVLVYRKHQQATTLAVGEGFLQVAPAVVSTVGAPPVVLAPDRVLVLVDQALPAAAVDRAAAEAELARAEAELAAWKKELDGAYQALLVRRDWALARLDATRRIH